MKKIDLIPRIQELYSKGQNILEFLKNESGSALNSIEDILISYDFQAGSYIKHALDNPLYIDKYSTAIAAVLNQLGDLNTVMEIGVGEATTLANVSPKLANRDLSYFGFDISWSRIYVGKDYSLQRNLSINLFVADLFKIPLPDNSIDVVYTSHSIEPNGGRESEALLELYRVARKFVVLLEPTNEFADEEGKARMKKNGYVHNLKGQIENLGYKLIDYRPFDVIVNPLNPTGLYVIQKSAQDNGHAIPGIHSFCCPISKGDLIEYADHFFCAYSLLSYPKILGIPCLTPSNAILTAKHH
ncbi:MAG: class I SAM-dependent methyltransferase [Chryseolinea sp.]